MPGGPACAQTPVEGARPLEAPWPVPTPGPLSRSGKPLRSFFSSYLKSLPDVREKMLSLPEKPNKEENPEIVVWREFDRQVFFLAPSCPGAWPRARASVQTLCRWNSRRCTPLSRGLFGNCPCRCAVGGSLGVGARKGRVHNKQGLLTGLPDICCQVETLRRGPGVGLALRTEGGAGCPQVPGGGRAADTQGLRHCPCQGASRLTRAAGGSGGRPGASAGNGAHLSWMTALSPSGTGLHWPLSPLTTCLLGARPVLSPGVWRNISACLLGDPHRCQSGPGTVTHLKGGTSRGSEGMRRWESSGRQRRGRRLPSSHSCAECARLAGPGGGGTPTFPGGRGGGGAYASISREMGCRPLFLPGTLSSGAKNPGLLCPWARAAEAGGHPSSPGSTWGPSAPSPQGRPRSRWPEDRALCPRVWDHSRARCLEDEETSF